MSTLNVDKVDPSTGTDLEIGTSGDTVTVPTGAGLTVVDEVKTNKVSPATGTAFALGDSGDTFTVPSGATIVNSGTATGFGITQTSFLPTANPLIINGDMAVSQTATSVTGINSGATVRTCDRWKFGVYNIGTWTLIQEALTSGAAFEAGFQTAFRADCTSATASPGAGDDCQFEIDFEGQDLQCFKKGSSGAEAYTLAFWVKSNKTGAASVNLLDADNTRGSGGSYTISVADTWEHKIINYNADTTGAFDNDNAKSLRIIWWMDSGSNYTSGTSSDGVWESLTAANRNPSNLALASSTSNDWAITGVQLEVGTYTSADLPPFRFESYGDNLQRCFRYYQRHPLLEDTTTDGFIGQGWCTSTAYAAADIQLYVPMRVVPSSGVLGNLKWRHEGTSTADSSVLLATNQSSKNIAGLYDNLGSGMTVGNGVSLMRDNDVDAGMTFNSEL